jgi:hypothetical protein
MSNQPEFIWARLDNATLYADGSSPCVARTKEFANGTKYVRADAMLAALVTAEKIIGREVPNGQAIIDIRDAIAKTGASDLDARMRKGTDEFAAILRGGMTQ